MSLEAKVTHPFPGIWRLRGGEPEAITPASIRKPVPDDKALAAIPSNGLPIDLASVTLRRSARSVRAFIPHTPGEGIFGFGLQMKSHLQSGKKRQLRVNADASLDQGDSHAPVPFFLSSKGYGVFIDTARYASFYIGTHASLPRLAERVKEKGSEILLCPEDLYQSTAFGDRLVVDIPIARGIDIYFFEGPLPLEALRRYVIFSGGGCLPPPWALGNWYRAFAEHAESDVLALACKFRDEKLPFDVLGLEPGWQTHFYPNTFVWGERFPDPAGFTRKVHSEGYHLNVWENAFIHPEASFADAIQPHCGSESSTDGLVPDFITPEACRIFAGHHRTELLEKGVDGFKLDECDNADFLPFPWSFPEYTEFPSGADGEQMHSLLGVLYQRVLHDLFLERNQRHFGLVRSSGPLGASLPFALYSDLYSHQDYLRGTVNAGVSGLLWCPEVRDAASPEDFVRRLQTVVFSPLSVINSWFIPNPPWEQMDKELNRQGILMERGEEITALVRETLELRMRLIPYLYTAFARYAFEGIPPVRAMFLEHPEDKRAWHCDSQFMFGPSLLVAPLMAGETGRKVYLPPGVWHEWETGTPHAGNTVLELTDFPLTRVPVFVRSGTILALARPRQYVRTDEPFEIEPVGYGAGRVTGALYEDDGLTYDYRDPARRIWHHLEASEGDTLQVTSSGEPSRSMYRIRQTIERRGA